MMEKEMRQMTAEEFKAECKRREPRVYFREEGKDGWTDLGDIMDYIIDGAPPPKSKAGPHWIDAERPRPNDRYLLGKFDFNTGEAVFYSFKQYQ